MLLLEPSRTCVSWLHVSAKTDSSTTPSKTQNATTSVCACNTTQYGFQFDFN
jgi:hypothetical protein